MKSRWIRDRAARLLPLLSSLLLLVSTSQVKAQDLNPGFEATLRLDKPRYVLGEEVRFWVGVRSTNGTPIPEDVINSPCRLLITKPDGSTETRTIGPTADRLTGATFSGGGINLGDKTQAGKYALVYECSKQKTKPVEVMVEENEIFNQVKAEFKFERSGIVKAGTSVPVVLSVQNNSAYTIRFPERGPSGADVGVEAIRENPPSSYMTIYPAEKLSHSDHSALSYTWDVSTQIPSVVLKPGEHFEQTFLFEEAYSFDLPGKYQVKFSTVLQVLVGEKNGPFAQVCPMRIPAAVAEQLVVLK